MDCACYGRNRTKPTATGTDCPYVGLYLCLLLANGLQREKQPGTGVDHARKLEKKCCFFVHHLNQRDTFGMKNRIFCPYVAAVDSILVSVMVETNAPAHVTSFLVTKGFRVEG
jgi:hypothetical protein